MAVRLLKKAIGKIVPIPKNDLPKKSSMENAKEHLVLQEASDD